MKSLLNVTCIARFHQKSSPKSSSKFSVTPPVYVSALARDSTGYRLESVWPCEFAWSIFNETSIPIEKRLDYNPARFGPADSDAKAWLAPPTGAVARLARAAYAAHPYGDPHARPAAAAPALAETTHKGFHQQHTLDRSRLLMRGRVDGQRVAGPPRTHGPQGGPCPKP